MKISVAIGAMEEPLTKQLKGAADEKTLSLLDRHSKNISWLYLHGILSSRETDSARKRLIRKVQQAVDANQTPEEHKDNTTQG
jgi:hypothetical protein